MWQSHSFYGLHTHTFSSADSQGLMCPLVPFFLPWKGFQKQTPHQEEEASRVCVLIHSSGGRSIESVCVNSLMRPGMFLSTLWEITSKLYRQELASLGAKPESFLISLRAHLASSFPNKPLWEMMTMMMMKIMMVRMIWKSGAVLQALLVF